MTTSTLQAIIEGSGDLVAAIDRDFTVTALNGAYAADFLARAGRRLAVGDDMRAALGHLPREGDAALQFWSRALAGESIGADWETGDGTRYRRHVSFFPLTDDDGKVNGAAQMVRDAPERTHTLSEVRRLNEELVRRVAQQTAALRDSQERFQSTFEHAPVGIAHIDLAGRWLTMNPGLAEITGYSESELRSRSFHNVTHPEDLDADLAHSHEMAAGRLPGYRIEKRFIRRDGSVVWVMQTAALIRAERPYVLAIVQDISERKTAELALRASEAEQRRLAAEALEAKAHADRANLAKSKFLAAASHDLRQPAQSLALFASVLEQRLAGTGEEAVVARIIQSIDGLRTLLDSLLDISRLDAGVVVPTPVEMAVGDLIGRLCAEYAVKAAAKGLDLRAVHTSQWVRTDPALTERILRNLLENAIRYTHEGRVLVGCRRGGDADTVTIEVHDSGIGIPPDQIDPVFDEFHQVGNPERDRSQGLGLGLAIVRRLAALLGHPISVRSALGRGSCFSVTLPRLPPAAVPVAIHDAQARIDGLTVMVVDDEDLVRTGLALMLEGWGYRVLAAASGSEALDLVASAAVPPDLVVVDYRLRDGEVGTDVVARLRTSLGAALPALILTGDTAPERISEAMSSRIAILHKPVATEELRAALNRLIS